MNSPATQRRIEQQAKIVAAHPRWHGVRADRVYFDVEDQREALASYTAALRRAAEDLARAEDLYTRISARGSHRTHHS